MRAFYKAFLLNDGEVLRIIKENCPDFRNGSIMSIDDVEEKPKFIYGKKEYILIVDISLNPKYTSLLMRRLKPFFIVDNFEIFNSISLSVSLFLNKY